MKRNKKNDGDPRVKKALKRGAMQAEEILKRTEAILESLPDVKQHSIKPPSNEPWKVTYLG